MIEEKEKQEIVEILLSKIVSLKQDIINETSEKVMLAIPEVIGNMMTQHAVLRQVNEKFYKDNPDLVQHKDSVVSVVEMIENEMPFASYEDILKKSVPEIRRRVFTVKNLDVTKVEKPVDLSFNGEI